MGSTLDVLKTFVFGTASMPTEFICQPVWESSATCEERIQG
jgi:hypothetical protein